MAAKKKKKKAKKASKAVKAKKTPAKKSPKKAKKAKKAPAKKAKKVAKAAAKKAPAKKAKRPAKKKTVGEGDYAASRKFDKAEAAFVAKNKAAIPAMGQAAEKALDGPEGDSLRDAEAAGLARSRDTF